VANILMMIGSVVLDTIIQGVVAQVDLKRHEGKILIGLVLVFCVLILGLLLAVSELFGLGKG